MKKLNNKGFGAVEGLLIFVILAIVGGTGFYVYKVNKDANNGNSGTTISKKSAKTEQAKDPYEGWLTYKSKLNSGLTFRYPADWKFTQDPEVFKNDGGGESLTASLYSNEPEREPGGVGAPNPASNIYMCVNFDEYGGDWSFSDSYKGKKPTSTEQFEVSNKAITLSTYQYPGDTSMMSRMILSSPINTPDDTSVSTNNGYIVAASAEFNCGQADNEILKSNTENFNQREEVKTAKLILKSINF